MVIIGRAVCVKVRMTMCGVGGKILGGGGTLRSSPLLLARLSEAQGGLDVSASTNRNAPHTIDSSSPVD